MTYSNNFNTNYQGFTPSPKPITCQDVKMIFIGLVFVSIVFFPFWYYDLSF